VRLAGAKVGSVTGLTLDQASYRAMVEIRIRDDLELPADSAVGVSASPLGDIYLSLTPGRSEAKIPQGGTIGAPS
jgi:phospholipid/cholesterol/gamma-HCH transport system substrate-binding protein